jgi:hypothetical protein
LTNRQSALIYEYKERNEGLIPPTSRKTNGTIVMKTMKAVFFPMSMLVTVLSFATPARAEIYYPWCANYCCGGGSNCGFSTIEQCRATISGIGGFCDPNPFYTPPSQKPARHLHRQDKRMEIAPSGGGFSLFATPGNPGD